MIAGLLLFLVLPLVMGVVVYFLRRWATLSALLSVGTALSLGIVIILVPLGRTAELWGRQIVMGGELSFLGRELVLEEVDRIAIACLYLTSAGIFTLTWRVSPKTMLFPVGLAVLSLLSGSLLIRPLIYAVLLLEVAIALSIFALQPEGRKLTQGGLQYLSFSLLAMPGLLVIHWLMDRYALTPDNRSLLDGAAILLGFSFALLLGSIPFHMWMPAVAGDSEPLASAFVFSVNTTAIWFLLFAFLETYPDLGAYPRGSLFASSAGLVMVAVGGLLVASQRRMGRLVGYSAFIDNGVALAALGLGSERGLALSFLAMLSRPLGLGLMAAGLKGLLKRSDWDDRVEALRGLGRRAPWSTLAFLVGGLSIAGLPITAGFAGRWALYRTLAPSSPATVLLMMLASIGAMIGMWRAMSALLAPRPSLPEATSEAGSSVSSEGRLYVVVVALGIIACIGVGLFPQSLGSIASRLAAMFTFIDS